MNSYASSLGQKFMNTIWFQYIAPFKSKYELACYGLQTNNFGHKIKDNHNNSARKYIWD